MVYGLGRYSPNNENLILKWYHQLNSRLDPFGVYSSMVDISILIYSNGNLVGGFKHFFYLPEYMG